MTPEEIQAKAREKAAEIVKDVVFDHPVDRRVALAGIADALARLMAENERLQAGPLFIDISIKTDDGSWFIEATELDYAAQGDSLEDAAARFKVGLEATFATLRAKLAALMAENENLKAEFSGLAESAGDTAADFNEVCMRITELFYPNVRVDGKAPSGGVVEIVKSQLAAAEAEIARLSAAVDGMIADREYFEHLAADERVKGVEYAMGFMNDKGSCSVGSLTTLKQYIARLKAGKGEG